MSGPDTIQVAAVQLSSQDKADQNLLNATQLVRRAAQAGARLIVLPENLAYMGPDPGKRSIAESLDAPAGPITTALSKSAREANAFVIAGGIPEASADPLRPYNTCAVFAPDGSLIQRYRKIHLFDVDLTDGTSLHESSATTAGTEPTVVVVDGFTVGLSICYDLRFPELYRRLTDLGSEIIIVPAAFTLTTGKDHWHVLVRARAIESQSYVIAAGQWGKHPGSRFTYGKSSIIDPWGEIIGQCSEGEGFCTATVDRAYMKKVRESLPALSHRRLSR